MSIRRTTVATNKMGMNNDEFRLYDALNLRAQTAFTRVCYTVDMLGNKENHASIAKAQTLMELRDDHVYEDRMQQARAMVVLDKMGKSELAAVLDKISEIHEKIKGTMGTYITWRSKFARDKLREEMPAVLSYILSKEEIPVQKRS